MGNSYNRKFSYPHWDASQHDDLYLNCFENSAEQWRNEVYDIYFAAPFLHRDVTYGDTMGVYASPGQYKNLLKIQEKYKDDTGKLNQEIMGLYQKEGVNPLGGCLPILIQMPLLIALFQVFRKTIEFRGASFLPFWITDLSQPDVIIQFEFLKNIWGINYFFGHGIALLPIIMGVVMFLNMKMTATNNINPSQASTMYIMNGFFILLFNTFPSGLNLYYTVYNILNFLQQKKLQKINS